MDIDGQILSKFTKLQHQHDSDPNLYRAGSHDFDIVIFIAVGLLLLRYLTHRFILYPMAAALGAASKKVKFAEAGWFAIYYTLVAFLATYLFVDYDWWLLKPKPYWFTPDLVAMATSWREDLTSLWQGYPHVYVDWRMKAYVMLQMGFYFHATVVICIEKKRRDFVELLLHHISTLLAIYMSWFHHYNRYCVTVLFLHDIGDVLLYTAKCLNYIRWQRICDAMFAMFALVFFWTRLVVFPSTIASYIFDSLKFIPYSWDAATEVYGDWKIRYFITSLIILVLLHCFWFYLICRMIVRALQTNTVESDIRSSDDEDTTCKSKNAAADGKSKPAEADKKKTS
eukprot:PLAT8015.1.p1 GENE.PLAT8015.1~~PLAT8015.1.p1  ORF type:complete len:340 (-),score=171.73 PLAT8015.1:76-1095(-)